MKDTVGMLLREAWKAAGQHKCLHAVLSQERSFSGIITGAYVCTTCGTLIELNPSQQKQSGATL